MSEHGAILQSNIMELVKYIESFKTQRSQLDDLITKEEMEKTKAANYFEWKENGKVAYEIRKSSVLVDLEKKAKNQLIVAEMNTLRQKLDAKNGKLTEIRQRRDDLDRTLDDTEAHLKQLLDSSHVVLSLIKREENQLLGGSQ